MSLRFLSILIFLIYPSFAQQKILKTIESDAPFIEIKTEGRDNLDIEESTSNELAMFISDLDGLGVVENFSCNDYNCVLSIKTQLKIDNPLTNKIHQFPIAPASNVSAVVKIPKDKKVTVFGEMIDVQTMGYQGVLRMIIDKGNVRMQGLKGMVAIDLFAGNVYAKVAENSLDIRTRKGRISLDTVRQSSPFRKKGKKSHQLVVKSINANIVLTNN